MANRYFTEVKGALEKGVSFLFASLKHDGSAATVSGLGFDSAARLSTGVYEVTAQDAFNRLLGAHVVVLHAGAGALYATLKKAVAADTPESIAQGKVYRIEVRDEAGALADIPATGEALVTLIVKNSSVV
ncbi:MAG: hypothetical protein QXP01_03735 [Candidatus Hadarchaeum sp.]